MRFYRLQMKAGSDGERIAEHFLSIGRITASLNSSGEAFNRLTPSDVILVHKGAFPLALVKVRRKATKEELHENSFGVDYFIENLSNYDELSEKEQEVIDLYGNCSPTGTFSSIKSGNTYNKVGVWYNIIKEQKTMIEKLDLLKFKNQIILQGPPGTGKTRLAKQMASALTIPEEITFDDIIELIQVGMEITSTSMRGEYKVVRIHSDNLEYHRKSTSKLAKLTFKDICKAYQNKIWLNREINNGSDTYSAAFAKYIYENYSSKQVKIIQFHPAYSYEDFVRGISVNSDDGKVSYNTENRILGEFAAEALKNKINSQKDQTDYAREQLIEQKITEYSNYVRDLIESGDEKVNEDVQITPAIKITKVEESAFRFEGKDWYDKLKFDQIKRMLLLGIKTSEELKETPGFVKTVYHRITYYLKVINNLRAKFPEVDEFPTDIEVKEELKKYVLIIDEINRANLPSVLGELIYALEYRNETVNSVYGIEGDNSLILPDNLYIIGTMNTSDRSVGHIDYAIRRRFAFVDVLPEVLSIENFQKEAFKKVSSLFVKNVDQYEVNPNIKLEKSDCLNDEFRPEDVWLGHSYFIAESKDFPTRAKYEIVPILKEYVKDGILRDIPETWQIIDELV